MHDSDLQIYLLQLVQCLKYELYHNNSLIRLLIRRSLLSPLQIGHFFYWHVKSEYLDKSELNLQYIERFGLYLEEYLLFTQNNIVRDILISNNICSILSMINSKVPVEFKIIKKKANTCTVIIITIQIKHETNCFFFAILLFCVLWFCVLWFYGNS